MYTQIGLSWFMIVNKEPFYVPHKVALEPRQFKNNLTIRLSFIEGKPSASPKIWNT